MNRPAVTYLIVNTPIGGILLAEVEGGLVRVAFENEDFGTVLGALSGVGHLEQRDTPVLGRALAQLSQYFTGARQEFTLPLDWRLSSKFRLTVQQQLQTIPYGEVTTYSKLAESIGNPQAVRAVGTACGTNPLPLVVPCHRVLRADGGIGGYLGGVEIKTQLLELEREVLARSGEVRSDTAGPATEE